MVFQPGQSGNPRGRRPEKEFATALRLAINEIDGDGVKKLRRIAEKLVSEAIAGEGWAIQQVADRLDGKPATIVEGNDENPLTMIHRIERAIVDAK